MSKLYVLELQNNKVYVGKTDNVDLRFSQHQSGNGAEWTRLHKPLRILETRDCKSAEDENNLTKEMMMKHGIDNVRGGAFCQRVLPEFVKQTLRLEQKGSSNACFKCGQSGHFAKDCQHWVWQCEFCPRVFSSKPQAELHEQLCQNRYRNTKNACFRCGRRGHYEAQCFARTDVQGNSLSEGDEDEDEEDDDDDDEF